MIHMTETQTPAKRAPKATAGKAAVKPAAKRAPRKSAAPKPGVPADEVQATAKATKQAVPEGAKASPVLKMTVPAGEPTTRQEWDAMVTAAKVEHKAYTQWRESGQPGGAKAEPKRPTLDKLNALKAAGKGRGQLPDSEAAKASRKGGNRRQGTIPQGKTAAGLDRLGDAETVGWLRKELKATPDATKGALHKAFREAGYGANAKRFERLIAQAKAAK
jgi:hypothetical protein